MSCIFKAGGGLYPRMRLGAVLLANAATHRFDDGNALTLEMQGVPQLKRALFALSGAGVDEVAVVLGHDVDVLEPLVSAFPVTVIRNDDERETEGIRAGLAALAGPFNAVLVGRANQPLLNAQDLQALIGAFKKTAPAAGIVPRVNGRLGMPQLLAWHTCEAALAEPAGAAGSMLAATSLTGFDTDNDHYTVAIDSPADIAALETRLGMRLGLKPMAAIT